MLPLAAEGFDLEAHKKSDTGGDAPSLAALPRAGRYIKYAHPSF
jgi:hypothetical protein